MNVLIGTYAPNNWIKSKGMVFSLGKDICKANEVFLV